MKIETIKSAFVLTGLAAFSVLLLLYVNGMTIPIIAEKEAAWTIEAQKELLPEAVRFEYETKWFGYKENPQTPVNSVALGFEEDGATVGYVVEITYKPTHADPIKMLVGIDAGFEVAGVKTTGIKANADAAVTAKAIDEGVKSALELVEKAFDKSKRTEIENELAGLEQETEEWTQQHTESTAENTEENLTENTENSEGVPEE